MKKADEIKALNREIEKEDGWIKLLEEKITLEQQLSAVRIKIIKRCVDQACVHRYRCKERLVELKKSKPKKAKKKRK